MKEIEELTAKQDPDKMEYHKYIQKAKEQEKVIQELKRTLEEKKREADALTTQKAKLKDKNENLMKMLKSFNTKGSGEVIKESLSSNIETLSDIIDSKVNTLSDIKTDRELLRSVNNSKEFISDINTKTAFDTNNVNITQDILNNKGSVEQDITANQSPTTNENLNLSQNIDVSQSLNEDQEKIVNNEGVALVNQNATLKDIEVPLEDNMNKEELLNTNKEELLKDDTNKDIVMKNSNNREIIAEDNKNIKGRIKDNANRETVAEDNMNKEANNNINRKLVLETNKNVIEDNVNTDTIMSDKKNEEENVRESIDNEEIENIINMEGVQNNETAPNVKKAREFYKAVEITHIPEHILTLFVSFY